MAQINVMSIEKMREKIAASSAPDRARLAATVADVPAGMTVILAFREPGERDEEVVVAVATAARTLAKDQSFLVVEYHLAAS